MAKNATTTIEPITKGSRVTGEARTKLIADMAKKYNAGATIRELHEETGRSFGAIQRLLIEGGVTMRPRGGARRSA